MKSEVCTAGKIKHLLKSYKDCFVSVRASAHTDTHTAGRLVQRHSGGTQIGQWGEACHILYANQQHQIKGCTSIFFFFFFFTFQNIKIGPSKFKSYPPALLCCSKCEAISQMAQFVCCLSFFFFSALESGRVRLMCIRCVQTAGFDCSGSRLVHWLPVFCHCQSGQMTLCQSAAGLSAESVTAPKPLQLLPPHVPPSLVKCLQAAAGGRTTETLQEEPREQKQQMSPALKPRPMKVALFHVVVHL